MAFVALIRLLNLLLRESAVHSTAPSRLLVSPPFLSLFLLLAVLLLRAIQVP